MPSSTPPASTPVAAELPFGVALQSSICGGRRDVFSRSDLIACRRWYVVFLFFVVQSHRIARLEGVRGGFALQVSLERLVAAAATPSALAARRTPVLALARNRSHLFLFLRCDGESGAIHVDRFLIPQNRRDGFRAALKREMRAVRLLVELNCDGYTIARFDIAEIGTLVVQDVERCFRRSANSDIGRSLRSEMVLYGAKDHQRDQFRRADVTNALANRAWHSGNFHDALAQTLARHFQQAEMADVADLDAGAVVPQTFFELALDGAIVAPLVHIDEVDDDQARKVAEAHLPAPLPRPLRSSS